MRIESNRTELQLRGGIEDNSKIKFLLLSENICCDPSLEPSQRDVSNDGSQNMFYGEIWLIIPNYPSYPFLSGAVTEAVHFAKTARKTGKDHI